ncbi:hypothetical protein HAX54_010260, partial [Datura stramonium]|nr:hypothetical protein [Datura stramonium]
MYNGLRGSGTSGYVQSNKFFVKPKTNKVVVDGGKGFKLKLLVVEEKLGYTDAEIAEKLEEARRTLEAASEDSGGSTAIIASQ